MYAQLSESNGRHQLRFTRRLAHSPDKVWRALTESEHLSAWFPTDIVGERAPGAALRFVFRQGEGPAMDGEMLAYQPETLLEFRWGTDRLRFELQADNGGTLLTFVDTFTELGRAARDAAGWHVCLDQLRSHLDNTTPSNPAELWRQVNQVYVQRFGPEAATIGPPDTSAVHA